MKGLFPFAVLVAGLSLQGCAGCDQGDSLPARHAGTSKNKEKAEKPPEEAYRQGTPAVVRMKKKDGVWMIPVSINGTAMDFIFDTGAGLITISAVEASYLYKQGRISDEDVLGSASFTNANGDIHEGTVINLKEVRIGERVMENVQASVTHNSKGPLLLGQSALEKFGRIQIDYAAETITFY